MEEQHSWLMTDKPILDGNGDYFIPLYYKFPFGSEININDNSALIRPFRKLLNQGKPIGNLTFIFYRESNEYHILGSFVKSEKRLLFFPGFKNPRVTRNIDGELLFQNGILQTVDHFSLEDNYRIYHLTLLEKQVENSRYRRFNTLKVADDLYLWLVIGLKDRLVLEPAPSVQVIELRGQNNRDLSRRYGELIRSRKGAQFIVTENGDTLDETHFINLEVFVSSKQVEFPNPKIFTAGVISNEGIDQRSEILTMLYKVNINEFEESIWLRISKQIGSYSGGDAVYVMNVNEFKL